MVHCIVIRNTEMSLAEVNHAQSKTISLFMLVLNISDRTITNIVFTTGHTQFRVKLGLSN